MPALDSQVLERARADDPQALDQVVRDALPLVLSWCARLGGPKVDHEDAAHDIMIVVMRKIGQLNSTDQFDAWLFSITRRVLAAHRRRAWVRRWVPGLAIEALAGAADESGSPLRASVIGDTAHRVRLALDELPAPQREAIILCDLEERTALEAAEMVGCPVGTMKSRLRLGRAAFSKAATRRGLADLALESS